MKKLTAILLTMVLLARSMDQAPVPEILPLNIIES